MAGAIHDQDLSQLRTNIIGGRVDTLVLLLDGATVQPSSIAPGYAVERTGAGEYTITVPKAQYHNVVATCSGETNILASGNNVADDQVTVTLLGGDPVGVTEVTLLIASGDIA